MMYLLGLIVLFFSAQASADAVGDLQTKGRAQWDGQLAKSITCTKAKLRVRKEWHVTSFQIEE
jgi:tyrosinase